MLRARPAERSEFRFHDGHRAGDQSLGASSNLLKSKPGATVQPTSVYLAQDRAVPARHLPRDEPQPGGEDTGQDGLQRFRKPLLSSVVRTSVERVGFALDVSHPWFVRHRSLLATSFLSPSVFLRSQTNHLWQHFFHRSSRSAPAATFPRARTRAARGRALANKLPLAAPFPVLVATPLQKIGRLGAALDERRRTGFYCTRLSLKSFPDGREQWRASAEKSKLMERTIIAGAPDQLHTSSSGVERQNLTMRMSRPRFSHLTNAFSNKQENLQAAVTLHFSHYNLVRLHKSLWSTPGYGRWRDR